MVHGRQLRLWLCWLMLLSSCMLCFSQKHGFTNFNVDQGLSQSQVYTLTQDRYGFLWAGTLGGLSRFDGHSFKTYDKSAGLISPLVFRTFVDNKNLLWVATQLGVQVFDGRQFQTVSMPAAQTGRAVNTIKQDKAGRMFVLCMGKIVQVSGMKGTLLAANPPSPVFKIETDKKGVLYALTVTRDIYAYINDQWVLYAKVPASSAVNQRYLLFFDHANAAFIITTDKLYENISGTLTERVSFNIGNNRVVSAGEDAENRLWIGTASGAYVIDRNYALQYYNAKAGLTDNEIYEMLTDHEGNLWFASDAEGLFRLNNQSFSYIDKNSGLNSNVVMGIARDGDAMWIATAENGLSKYDGKDFTSYPIPSHNGQTQKMNSLFMDSRRRLWMGVLGGGLWMRENERFKEVRKPDGKQLASVISITEQSDGTIWLGTAAGPYHFSNDSLHKIEVARDVCFSIFEAGKDSMLLGTAAGLQLLTGKNKIKNIPIPQLSNVTVNCLIRFGKYFLIGTSEDGIIFWNPSTNEMRTCSKKDGLASNFIFSMYPSDDGQIWVGTGSGIHTVKLNEQAGKFNVKRYSLFNSDYGPECNLNAIAKDNQNRLWFGTIKGIVLYTPTTAEQKITAPLIYLKSAQLFSKEMPGKDTVIGWNKIPFNPLLKPSENHLSFDFTGIYLTNPSGIRYRYMLEGADTGYSSPGINPQVIYSNLPSGKYVFRAIAITEEGIVSSNAIAFPFEIATPFYQTFWFQLLMIIMLIGIGVLIQYSRVRLRHKRLAAIQAIRQDEQRRIQERTSEDLHDDLGNKITRITVLADVLSSKIDPADTDKKKLVTQIKENAQALYLSTKDIIWSLAPGNDSLYDIFDRVQTFGLHLFDGTNVEFTLKGLHDDCKQITVPLAIGRNLVMIIKESLNNILKHAQAENAVIEISCTDHLFDMIIMDDGKGIEPSRFGKGLGLDNIQKRVSRINGTLEIKASHPGTVLHIAFKIPRNEG